MHGKKRILDVASVFSCLFSASYENFKQFQNNFKGSSKELKDVTEGHLQTTLSSWGNNIY